MKTFITAIIMILTSNGYCVEIAGKDYVKVSLDSATYEFVLPPPFGRSAVSAVLSSGKIVAMTVTTDAGQVVIDQNSLDPLSIEGGPTVSVPYSRERSDGWLQSFSLGFESGTEYQVTLADVPGCADQCTDWVKDMVSIVIYEDCSFKVQVFKMERILKGRNVTD